MPARVATKTIINIVKEAMAGNTDGSRVIGLEEHKPKKGGRRKRRGRLVKKE